MPQGRPPGLKKKSSSYRLTEEAIQLLAELASHYGVNNSDMLEFIIRQQARAEGIWPTKTNPPSPPPRRGRPPKV